MRSVRCGFLPLPFTSIEAYLARSSGGREGGREGGSNQARNILLARPPLIFSVRRLRQTNVKYFGHIPQGSNEYIYSSRIFILAVLFRC